jgi:hypothetical protein
MFFLIYLSRELRRRSWQAIFIALGLPAGAGSRPLRLAWCFQGGDQAIARRLRSPRDNLARTGHFRLPRLRGRRAR